ncbi:MAG: FAD-dependent oxidoreductase [Crocinitomicaceae bacterium]|nr:FAD-dependent oxidoreductase [Crocinitomicaceae bacterium]MDG1656961.1 FAD-dependent oxidoreductase [Crocinitomicaceae bacterium]
MNEKWSYWECENYVKNIDFLVIGAGIVGYTTALSLKEKNPEAKVVILERGILPSGASSKNAGFACFGSATEIFDDIEQYGEELVWETVALRWKGLQTLRATIGDDSLDLQINGSWDLITDAENSLYERVVPKIDYYNVKIAEITGEQKVYTVDTNVANRFGFKNVNNSISNRLEGQINTGMMNQAFYQKVIAADIRVLFGAEVNEITQNQSSATAQTSIGDFEAAQIAVCTNGFAKQLLNEEVEPARAQVLITKPIPNLKIKGTFHYQQGYYYFRNINDRILFGGGRNLNKLGETTTEIALTDEIMRSLKYLLRTIILPDITFEIDHEWSGIMGVGNSKKPIVKKVSQSIFCGVRLGGMGVAIGSLVGQDLATMITKDKA